MFLMISLYVLDVYSVPLPHADLKPEPPRYFNCDHFLSSSPCQPRVLAFFFFFLLRFIPSLSPPSLPQRCLPHPHSWGSVHRAHSDRGVTSHGRLAG